jgi:hexosaminidase
MVDVTAKPEDTAARVTLASQTGFGQIRYTLDGRPPTARSTVYGEPIRVALPSTLRAASFVGARRVSPILDKHLDSASVRTRASQELNLCPGTLPLNLEGAATANGRRPVFLIQIMNPCWVWPDANMSDVSQIRLTLASAPFNLQLGAEIDKVVHRPASSPNGEFQVRLDNCDTGELVAVLPLRPGRTELELAADIKPTTGVHALCFAYAGGERLDPIWGIDKVELFPRGHAAQAPGHV